MKKVWIFLLIAVMCLSFVACGGENTKNNGNTNNDTNNQLDEATLQTKYDHAINELSRYLSVNVAWNDSGEALFNNEAAHYLYNEFKALGNYKDSADYFDRFLVLDNALTKITKPETDVFGNTNEKVHKNYEYTAYGECPALSDFFELIGLINTSAYKYEYAPDGKITTIDTFEYGEQVLKASIVYDEKGNIVEVNYLTKGNIVYSNKYTYNENNKLISADKNIMTSIVTPMGYWDCHLYVEYTYNASGRVSVVTETITPENDEYKRTKETAYSYDSDGNISEEHITITYESGSSSEETKVYAYNDNGSVSSVQVTKKDTSYTLVYHYETLYIYQYLN